jgi:prephenate dehydrogenase
MHADFVIVSVPVDVAHGCAQVLEAIGEQTIVLKWVLQNYLFVKVLPTIQKEKFYSYASYCWNVFGTIGSDKRLVSRKTNIICEVEKTTLNCKNVPWRCFKKWECVRYMDPKSHDKHIAYVSHLSHISAFMLGKTVIDKENTSRIFLIWRVLVLKVPCVLLKSSPAMWTPILNKSK